MADILAGPREFVKLTRAVWATGVTAKVTATSPAVRPIRRAMATTDSALTAQHLAPCLVLIRKRSTCYGAFSG
jgi:hypothetical protein